MERQDGDAVRVAVIYYSATGNVDGLARAVAEGAEEAGAEVRLRHIEELASELMISQNQHWGRHRSRVADAPSRRSTTSPGRTGSLMDPRLVSGMSQRS